MNLVVTVSCPCLSFRLYAANALGIAVVADTVAVLVTKEAAVSAVVAAVSASIAKSVAVFINKGTILAAVIPAVFAVVAYAVSVFITVGAIPAAVVNGNCASALTSPAVMSAVSGYGNARHRNSQSKYGSNSQQFFHKTSSFQVKFIVCLQFTYQSCCSANIYKYTALYRIIGLCRFTATQPAPQCRTASAALQPHR